ncbi:TonB-dependent receptor [Massilia sp. PAMC28688]|uniref:TonB-dependent receptor n=1 Tax=Massilia sp. PAMC28688 TaxID=2861283 RepID=UPI001C62AA07|nr:TonB-dependent receptor [Massilia sp. PAMC28688]QYF92660.1 TonB-dependent receptor [Massilia sp. PAMC28688]
MKISASAAASAMPCQSPSLKTLVVTLAGAGLIGSASGVWAQAATPATPAAAEPTVVTVTGVRQAARSAQLIKQNAEQVLDSIVAEDIGKFPDKNVAEILGRVTGVQILRGAGEAGTVVIRGLGNVGTLLNGREVFTAANRGIVLSDIPVAMLQRVDVYKSQGADMVEGGVAGVVDVRTFKPFDFKDDVIAVAARVEHRDKADSYDPNLSMMASKRWKGAYGEIGALGGLSYQRGRYHDETSWVSPPMLIDGGVEGARAVGRVMNTGDRKRLAVNGALHWRPSSEVELYADIFSTKIDHVSQSIFFVGDLPINKGGTVTTVPGTNYLRSISHPGASEFTLSSTQARDDLSMGTQSAVGGRWDVAPTVRATAEFVRTVSNYRQDNPIVDVVDFAVKPMEAGIRDGGGYVDYPGYNMGNPANWNLFGFFDNHNDAKGRANDLRSDVTWDLEERDGWLKEVTGGVRFADRNARAIRELNGYMPAPGGISAASLPGMSCLSPATGGDYGMNQFYAPCHTFLLENTSAVRAAFGSPGRTPDDPMSFFEAREKTAAVYVKGKYGFNIGPVPVDGNVGVRVVRTNMSIDGNSRSGDAQITPVNVDTSSTDVLPSMTLRAKFRQNLIGRFVAGKTIERAAFGDYNPGLRLSTVTPTTPATGSSGNPNLKPQEGRNLDLALEWYFAPTGSITGTAFKREFKNYIRRSGMDEVHGGVTYRVDRPYNTVEGELEGFELAYQQFYEKLPGWLGGLGLQANVTYMKGGLTEVDRATQRLVTNDFAGMSKLQYNIVGLYERDAWSARVAYNWRDKFVAEYDYRASGFNLMVAPIKTLDASLSYKINTKVTLTLDGTNLLDTPYNDYHGVPQLARDIRRFDRTVGLSLRWKN